MYRSIKKLLLIISAISVLIHAHPRLIVGVVIDQMRMDYLYQLSELYSENGFKRLLREGAVFTNAHYHYTPTYTAPGHASIYTGTTPSMHGIIANSWYNKGENEYCVADRSVQAIGIKETETEGQMSPKNLLTDTFADALKLATGLQSRSYAISMKDRGAILPGGKMADAAYWFVGGKYGKFISSSYYMKNLPKWVETFNQTRVDRYMDSTWTPYFAADRYFQYRPDDNKYEAPFKGEKKTSFPYVLQTLKEKNGGYSILSSTPFGNTLLKEFAQTLIVQEKLGQNKAVDFLSISFSSIDKIGHQFGFYSYETQDAYVRLDREIADLLQTLDHQIGKDQYVLFITGDHAGLDIPQFLADQRLNAGGINEGEMQDSLNEYLHKKLKIKNLVANVSNFQVYINTTKLTKTVHKNVVEEAIVEYLEAYPHMAYVVTRKELKHNGNFLHGMIQNGFHLQRSGDVFFLFEPYYAENNYVPATHGSPYNYDTHVPLIFMGWKIAANTYSKPVQIADIVTTLANLLRINPPSAARGQIILDQQQKK